MATETLQFKAEIQQLLEMMIHSVYSNKEIFLRELTANAADAIDKAKFAALTHPEQSRDWEIRISTDPEAKTLTISDNGIGMDHDELVKNIGTIAYSGTKAFLEAMQKAKEEGKDVSSPELIGQFGVGFYSAFMAADKVAVVTKKFDSAQAWRWESDGKSAFTIEEAEKDGPGTDIILSLTDDFKDFLDYWRVSEVIRKYSDFIAFPIKMKHTVKKDGKDEIEDSTLNTMTAIWLRPESEVKDEEYTSFYRHISGDFNDPACRINFNAEGAAEFKALLFFASKVPYMFQFGQKPKSVHLYVKRVFITDECPNLLPEYMGFVSGVVDSSDLPLNVSRETLQDNPMITRINKALTKRILSELAKMLEKDRAKYEAFYREFSRMLKEGVHADFANREKLQDLLLFETLKGGAGKLVTLKEYTDAMPSTQKAIYYISGESRAALEDSPQLEMLKKQGFDVLLALDPVDDFILTDIQKYAEKEVCQATRGDVKLDDSVQKELDEKTKKAGEDNKDLVEFLKKSLADKVKDVRFSARLTESPCCLVTDAMDPSENMQKFLKAVNKDAPDVKRILELNPENALILALKSLVEKNAENPKLAEYAEMLFDQAIISEGGQLPDPVRFAKRTAELMTAGLEKELSAE